MTKNLFTFYSLESPTEEEGNLNERLVISLVSTFVGVKKLCFICNEYRESDSNACNFGDLTRGCKEGVRCKLLDRINSFLQEPTKKFHEAATRLIKENRIRT